MTRPASPDAHVNFDAPAILRKWPSLNNHRRTAGTGPYLLLDGTPDEYGAGLKRAITNGWLTLHESGTFVTFTQAGADLCA
jgi:hypothetical protein